MEIYIGLVSLLLILIGIGGVFFPALPGLLVSFGGLLLYNYLSYGGISLYWIIPLGVLTILSLVLEYLIPLKTAKKYGGSSWGNWGGFLGMCIGFFLPIPLGFLLGMFVGVFIGELLKEGKSGVAFSAVKGALVGFILSTSFNFIVGMGMLVIFLWHFIPAML